MLINVLNRQDVTVSPLIAWSLLETSDLAMDSTWVASEVLLLSCVYVYCWGLYAA